MIESHVSELLGRRRESIMDLARGAGIAYATAHQLYHHAKAKGIEFDTLAKLCRYFECQPGDLFTYRPTAETTYKRPRTAATAGGTADHEGE